MIGNRTASTISSTTSAHDEDQQRLEECWCSATARRSVSGRQRRRGAVEHLRPARQVASPLAIM
jgi:hypothetical protein